jgi:hypothetical protein
VRRRLGEGIEVELGTAVVDAAAYTGGKPEKTPRKRPKASDVSQE